MTWDSWIGLDYMQLILAFIVRLFSRIVASFSSQRKFYQALPLVAVSHNTPLSAGDMIPQETKYHPRCLVSFYNKASALQKEKEDTKIEKVSHGFALAEFAINIY